MLSLLHPADQAGLVTQRGKLKVTEAFSWIRRIIAAHYGRETGYYLFEPVQEHERDLNIQEIDLEILIRRVQSIFDDPDNACDIEELLDCENDDCGATWFRSLPRRRPG